MQVRRSHVVEGTEQYGKGQIVHFKNASPKLLGCSHVRICSCIGHMIINVEGTGQC